MVVYHNDYVAEARQRYKTEYLHQAPDGPPAGIYLPDIEIDYEEIYVDGSKLCVSGVIHPTGPEKTNIAYFSVNIPIETSVMVDLISYYTKQVNKLKTILEASKGGV